MKDLKKAEKTLGFSNIEKILKKDMEKQNGEKDTYKGLKNLEKDLKKNKEIKKAFADVKSQEEAIKIAQNLGYNINEKELEGNEELAESILESIAGGRTKVKVRSYSFNSDTLASGKDSYAETSVTWKAGGK